MYRLVVTDGYTMNPGDLSWEPLHEIASVVYYDRLTPHDIVSACADADLVITNKTVFDQNILAQLPKLKAIFVTATGYNNIDISSAQNQSIAVYNVQNYSTESVAQHVIACMLDAANSIRQYIRSVRQGDWQRSQDFSYSVARITELKDKTIGIVGYGDIGRRIAEMALAFGLRVMVYSSHLQKSTEGITFVDLDELLAQADFVSINTRLTTSNQYLFDKKTLAKMKSTAVLINIARAQLIVEKDLYTTLKKRRIAAAYLDVLSEEPPTKGNPLIGLPNCYITPHVAWSTFESRSRLLETTISNIISFMDGSTSLNRVV